MAITFFPEGSTPLSTDNEWRSLIKIVDRTSAGAVPIGALWASGAGAPAEDGSISKPFYKNTSTGAKYANVGTVAVPAWEAI